MSECNFVGCNSVDSIYYQRNRDVILHRAKNYFENDKERLREKARDRYRNLSEEEKNKEREYGKSSIKFSYLFHFRPTDRDKSPRTSD